MDRVVLFPEDAEREMAPSQRHKQRFTPPDGSRRGLEERGDQCQQQYEERQRGIKQRRAAAE
ncbi:hypothetical protein [Pantoea dispersa]|uniref:hypothetical protein n=1 Tax=Pantoea dispersa TaxID=59814 RepID=UPI001CA6255D|nr:hypothetical protein [Pantoea dispersa]QZY96685.1 hypothetical protein K7X52_09730 [Pantoea dispersa]